MTLEDVTTTAAAYGREEYVKGAQSRQVEIDQLKAINATLASEYDALEAEYKAHMEAEHPAPTPPAVKFQIGAAVGGNTDPAAFEKRIGHVLDARRTYMNTSDGDDGQITKAVSQIKANITAGRPTSSPSFKVPVSMSSAATGGADAWAKKLANALAGAIKGTSHTLRVAINHEPENDVALVKDSTGKVTNGPALVKFRDDWKAFQTRVSPFFDLPGITYIVILMGDHQWNSGANYYPWWSQDKVMSGLPATVKGVGYDYYERYGQAGSTRWTGWGWIDKAKVWFADHHLVWGLSETAWTEEAEKAKPGQTATMKARVSAGGGTWLEYFNTDLNSAAHWEMDPGSAREKEYGHTLNENH